MLNLASLIILGISSFIAVIFAPKEYRVTVLAFIITIVIIATVIYFFSYVALPVVSFIAFMIAMNMIRMRLS